LSIQLAAAVFNSWYPSKDVRKAALEDSGPIFAVIKAAVEIGAGSKIDNVRIR